MKHLKHFKLFEGEELFIDFDSMSDEDLVGRIKELRILIEDFQSELSSVFKEQKRRKEESQKKQQLPTNIFDLNQDQFNIVFGDASGQTDYGYKRMHEYEKQLVGCNQDGFIKETNQQSFRINSSYYFSRAAGSLSIDDKIEERTKSIKFISKMLKGYNLSYGDFHSNNAVKFNILYGLNDDYEGCIFYDKNTDKFYFKIGYRRVIEDSLENILKLVDQNDVDDED